MAKAKKEKTARTYADVAEHFKVHRDTVRRDWKASGMPKLPASFESLEKWRETLRERTDIYAASNTSDDALIEARKQKIMAEAEQKKAAAAIARHQVLLLDDSVCTVEQIDQFMSQWFTELRTMLTRLPEELAAAYPPKFRHQIEEDLSARVDLILRAMHGHAESLATIKD